MQITKKWQINISYVNDPNKFSSNVLIFWIYENFYSNVLRDLAKFDFGTNVHSIEIREIKEDKAIVCTTTIGVVVNKLEGKNE